MGIDELDHTSIMHVHVLQDVPCTCLIAYVELGQAAVVSLWCTGFLRTSGK